MDLKRLFIRPDTEVSKPTVPTEGQGDQSADTAKQTTGGLRQKLAGAGSRLASILLKDEEKLGTSPAEAPAAPAAPRPESRGLRARIAGALFKNDAQVAQDAEAARAKKAEAAAAKAQQSGGVEGPNEAGEYEFPVEDLHEHSGFKVHDPVMVLRVGYDSEPQAGWVIERIRVEDHEVKFYVMSPAGDVWDLDYDELVKIDDGEEKVDVDVLFSGPALITAAEVEALGKEAVDTLLYSAEAYTVDFAQRVFGITDLNAVSKRRLRKDFENLSEPYLPQNNDEQPVFESFCKLLIAARDVLLEEIRRRQRRQAANEPENKEPEDAW